MSRYGNLPYSALHLLPFPYESTKDAIQKLIRAGYVGVVKAKHLKGLYATAAGTKAAEETYMRNGYEFFGRHPVVYHASKLERVHRLHETELLFAQADIGCPVFQNSRDLKRKLEQKPRAADKLKYSRFAGIWNNNGLGWVVYHFGRTNMQLNESGELNARLFAEEIAQGYARLGDMPMLILGSSADTALSILRYFRW